MSELICVGFFYPEWYDQKEPVPTFAVVTGLCFLIHFLLSIFIKLTKKRSKFNVTKQSVNLGDKVIVWFRMVTLFWSIYFLHLNNTRPEMMQERYIILYVVYFGLPIGYNVGLSLIFFGKNQRLRKTAYLQLQSLKLN